MKRENWIDWAKAVGILFVVMGQAVMHVRMWGG